MKKIIALSVATALSVAGVATFHANSANSPDDRAATVKHLMAGINKTHMPKIATSANKSPATDKEWGDLELSAAMVNEISFSLMEGGRNRDETWNKSCLDLRNATAEIVKGAQAKSYAGISDAARRVGGACKACHDVHKKDQ